MEEVKARPGAYRGVWYSCGRANLLPGKSYVYSGPMATSCAWHRPMAVWAPEVVSTFFVFGDAENAPAIGCFDHRTGRFSTPAILGSNPDGDAHRNPALGTCASTAMARPWRHREGSRRELRADG